MQIRPAMIVELRIGVDGVYGGAKSSCSNVTLFHVKHPVSL